MLYTESVIQIIWKLEVTFKSEATFWLCRILPDNCEKLYSNWKHLEKDDRYNETWFLLCFPIDPFLSQVLMFLSTSCMSPSLLLPSPEHWSTQVGHASGKIHYNWFRGTHILTGRQGCNGYTARCCRRSKQIRSHAPLLAHAQVWGLDDHITGRNSVCVWSHHFPVQLNIANRFRSLREK